MHAHSVCSSCINHFTCRRILRCNRTRRCSLQDICQVRILYIFLGTKKKKRNRTIIWVLHETVCIAYIDKLISRRRQPEENEMTGSQTISYKNNIRARAPVYGHLPIRKKKSIGFLRVPHKSVIIWFFFFFWP